LARWTKVMQLEHFSSVVARNQMRKC